MSNTIAFFAGSGIWFMFLALVATSWPLFIIGVILTMISLIIEP